MENETWHVGDLDNGVLESFISHSEALEYYNDLVANGIELEKEIQYATGLTDSEISEKVQKYLFIINNQYYKI